MWSLLELITSAIVAAFRSYETILIARISWANNKGGSLMGSIATVTLKDDDADATSAVFEPKSVVAGIASWLLAGVTAAGARLLTQSYSDATASRQTEKIRVRLAIPKEVQQADLTYLVVSTGYISIEVTVPVDWDSDDREIMASNLRHITETANPLHLAVHDAERVYG
jgi:hypothetical protein